MIRDVRRTLTICLAVAGLALATAGSAQGAINVTNTNDSGPGSLRQATEEAPPGETINVPAGTYTLTSEPLILLEKSLTISGSGSASTIIRAGEPFPVVVAIGPADTTISGVTIRDGVNIDKSAFGGGILSIETTLTLRGVVVTNNIVNANGAAGVEGGDATGAGIVSGGGALNLIDSTVSNNLATAIGGSGKEGGDAIGAGLLTSGPVTIVNSTISGNTADARGGQGPANAGQDGGEALGGGLIAFQLEGAPMSIRGSTINGNVVDASAGAGGEGGQGGGGGAYVLANSGTLTLANTTIASNVMRSLGASGKPAGGGGILATANSGGAVAFSSMTISGNRIEAPASPFGGGNVFAVSEPGAISFANSIVAAGAGPPGAENCDGLETKSLGFNIDSLDQCGFKAAGDKVNTDPQLGPLQNNGGLTATMAPALAGPAIDQGGAFGLTSDQRGILRPIDLPSIPNAAVPGADGSDIGAVEFQPSNAFSLGKLTKDKKKGTAKLAVKLPQPSAGVLTLEGKGLKKQTKQVTGQTEVKMKIVGKGKVKKALKKKGKRKVTAKVTYTPTGNSAATKSKKAKLVKKKKKKKKKKNSKG